MEKIPDIIHQSWHEYLQPLFDDPKMKIIKETLLPSVKFYPDWKQIFRVFSMPLTEIKVVILGQDPYFNGSANGLAFAVNERTTMPASLKVIAQEIEAEGLKSGFYDSDISHWRTLESWHEQGVFLLNTALTVEVGQAGSHMGQWQWFTREVITTISKYRNCIWMLWGAKAQSFQDYILNSYQYNQSLKEVLEQPNPIGLIVSEKNYILKAPHPAAGLYSGGKTTFLGCNHFNICNQILEHQKKLIINW